MDELLKDIGGGSLDEPRAQDLEEIEADENNLLDGLPASDPVRAYLDEIGSVPLMTPDEEREAAQAASLGDEDAIRRLTEANLRLVVSVAVRFKSSHMELLDRVQNGNLGLMRAARQFRPELGFKFSTYATWWIRQAIIRGSADQSRAVRIPAHASDQASRIAKAEAALRSEGNEHPTERDISEATGIPAARVLELRQASEPPLSIDALTGPDHDTALSAFLRTDAPSPQEVLDRQSMLADIRRVLDILPDRERYVLACRFGLDGERPKTLPELASELGVSSERVRQLEAKAFQRIRNPKYSRALIPYLDD